MHLLSGARPPDTVAFEGSAPVEGDVVMLAEITALKANVRHLEDELEALRRTVADMRRELGGA